MPPGVIRESKPRPATVSAKVPWISEQARTHREQTMQAARVVGEVGVRLVGRLGQVRRAAQPVAHLGHPDVVRRGACISQLPRAHPAQSTGWSER